MTDDTLTQQVAVGIDDEFDIDLAFQPLHLSVCRVKFEQLYMGYQLLFP